MERITFSQPSLSIAEQLALLQEKGLIVNDITSVEHWLSHNSYFRFKHYSYSFKNYGADGKYLPGITFEQIADLYLFDRKLRMLVFAALENIEIAVKTQLTNIMSTVHGPHWYVDPGHFISEQERKHLMGSMKRVEDMPTVFDHTSFLEYIQNYMQDPIEPFLKAYKATYDPLCPPSWIMVEIITFGTLSILYENLKPGNEKTAIHEHFGLTKKHLISWLHCFSFIRNKCAHHARLIYAKINFAPAMPQHRSRQFLMEADDVNNASLYAVLCCIQFVLNTCNNKSLFKEQLFSLIEAYPMIDYNRLGFTKRWKNESLWQLH